MRIFKSLVIVTFVSLFVSGCCSCRISNPKLANVLENNSWVLSELRGEKVDFTNAKTTITLNFNAVEKMMYGTAPCNNFFAGYSILDTKEQNIKFSALGATRRFCEGIMELEEMFTKDVATVVRLKVEGDNLLMINPQGSVVAILQKVPTISIQ